MPQQWKCFACPGEPNAPPGKRFPHADGVCPRCKSARHAAPEVEMHLAGADGREPLCGAPPVHDVTPKGLVVDLNHVTAVPAAANCPACLQKHADHPEGAQ